MTDYDKHLDKNNANFVPLTPISFLERAKDPDCAPPYRDDYDDIEDIELIRKRVDDKWDSLVSFLS